MKLVPLMNSTAIVHEQFPQRSRDNQSSALYKERRDGLSRLLLTGANSPAALSQVTINNMVLDDVSKWDTNPSGDPESMAESRSRAIADAKIFKISTPTLSPGCRISRSFAEGSQEMPFVPCVHCGELKILTWDNMLANLDPEHPEHACFSCTGCGGILEEHHRPQMLRGFEWRASNPAVKADHRSFLFGPLTRIYRASNKSPANISRPETIRVDPRPFPMTCLGNPTRQSALAGLGKS